MKTRDEFERDYCESQGITLELFRRHHVALPCACEAIDGPHWAAITLMPACLISHLQYRMPDSDGLDLLNARELP